MILLRKAVRSIWRNKKAYIACIALLAIGVAMYVAFNMLYLNLQGAQQNMYAEQRFADVFATVEEMPLERARALSALEGIGTAAPTIVTDTRVDSLESTRIITLRLHSWDAEDADMLNAFLLVEGALPGDDGILVNDVFAEAHGLVPGDEIALVTGGRRSTFTVSGLVQSPEYVYAIPDLNTMFPDNEAFGFGYVPYRILANLTGRAGSATSIAFSLEDGYDYDAVKAALEDALKPWGMRQLYPRKDQLSEAMLAQEIDSIGSMASSIPMVFILMAVIILYIMLKRVIEQERSQIGTLKAFGYADRQIVLHYMCYGGLTGVAGGALGILLGLLMTSFMTDLYLVYFNLPSFAATPSPLFLSAGLLISVGSGLLGAFMGTRSVLRLTPSEAMRPPAPPAVRGDLAGRLPVLRLVLASSGYMAVRNITRNRFRSAFVVCGIAFSFSIMAFMASFGDMMDALILNQFTRVQLYDMKVTLEHPQPYTPAVESAWALEGVREVEAMLELPVELRLRHLREGVSLTAMEPGSRLYNIYDNVTGEVFEPPEGGVILSASLADKLQARRGDLLTLRSGYTDDRDIPLPVLGVVNENLGQTAYIDLDSLCALLDIPRSANSVILRSEGTEGIRTQLLDASNVAALADKAETQVVYDELLETYVVLIWLMQLGGIGVAFAIITNTASISLSERSREYATMRVLGMHPREIGRVVAFEYWLLTLVGLLPGIPLTRLIKMSMAGMIDNDLFTIPLDTPAGSYLTAAACCAVAVAISNRSAVRRIAGFDMVETLKERE